MVSYAGRGSLPLFRRPAGGCRYTGNRYVRLPPSRWPYSRRRSGPWRTTRHIPAAPVIERTKQELRHGALLSINSTTHHFSYTRPVSPAGRAGIVCGASASNAVHTNLSAIIVVALEREAPNSRVATGHSLPPKNFFSCIFFQFHTLPPEVTATVQTWRPAHPKLTLLGRCPITGFYLLQPCAR